MILELPKALLNMLCEPTLLPDSEIVLHPQTLCVIYLLFLTEFKCPVLLCQLYRHTGQRKL